MQPFRHRSASDFHGGAGCVQAGDPTDGELVRAFQAGDEAAFSELIRRHRRAVYAAAHSVLRGHDAADEAAQDAFLKAWHGLRGFKGDSSVRTWLYRIGLNAAHDLRSREATQQRAKDETRRLGGPERDPAPRPRALEDLIAGERLGRVRAAVERLPERQRLTLTLKVVQDLKYTEIASLLQCPVGTVKANFHHAVQNLRKLLGAAPATAGEPGAVAAGELS
jgi:RNA polymerase sigma-70 factor (ECF subfamily)